MPKMTVVLLGKTGAGKSASGNTILGQQAFSSEKSCKSVTKTVCDISVTVYDTPGLFNTHMSEQEILQMINEEVLQKCESGLCVFLLIIKADRFTEEERETVERIEKLLGEKRLEKTWILFTRGDELEEDNMNIEEFLNNTEPLKKLIQKYDQRYHVFNNKIEGDTTQVQKLFNAVVPKITAIEHRLNVNRIVVSLASVGFFLCAIHFAEGRRVDGIVCGIVMGLIGVVCVAVFRGVLQLR